MIDCEAILRVLDRKLREVSEHRLSSQLLADWSDDQYWYLQEELGQTNKTSEANFLGRFFTKLPLNGSV